MYHWPKFIAYILRLGGLMGGRSTRSFAAVKLKNQLNAVSKLEALCAAKISQFFQQIFTWHHNEVIFVFFSEEICCENFRDSLSHESCWNFKNEIQKFKIWVGLYLWLHIHESFNVIMAADWLFLVNWRFYTSFKIIS